MERLHMAMDKTLLTYLVITRKFGVHSVFPVKHDVQHKVRLMADGYLAPEPIESINSGVVFIRRLRMSIFLTELNKL